jgi:hypothetical protein
MGTGRTKNVTLRNYKEFERVIMDHINNGNVVFVNGIGIIALKAKVSVGMNSTRFTIEFFYTSDAEESIVWVDCDEIQYQIVLGDVLISTK